MKELVRVLAEMAIVTAVGCALALAANAARSARGIEITRVYFFQAPGPRPDPPAGTQPAPTTTQSAHHGNQQPVRPPAGGDDRPYDEIAAELMQQGLQPLPHDEVSVLFHDGLYGQAYIFIDARDNDHYPDGHIPGAYHINPFWSTGELNNVIQSMQTTLDAALKIVVYCNGGDCTDSTATTRELINRGVDPTKLFIDVEGFKRWSAENLPVERGRRNSGVISGERK